MRDDPVEFVRNLVQQHGREAAMQEALRQALEAQADRRLYDLSAD